MKKDSQIVHHPALEITPPDVAISRVIQNLFATYGEKKVRASAKELFGRKRPSKKAA